MTHETIASGCIGLDLVLPFEGKCLAITGGPDTGKAVLSLSYAQVARSLGMEALVLNITGDQLPSGQGIDVWSSPPEFVERILRDLQWTPDVIRMRPKILVVLPRFPMLEPKDAEAVLRVVSQNPLYRLILTGHTTELGMERMWLEERVIGHFPDLQWAHLTNPRRGGEKGWTVISHCTPVRGHVADVEGFDIQLTPWRGPDPEASLRSLGEHLSVPGAAKMDVKFLLEILLSRLGYGAAGSGDSQRQIAILRASGLLPLIGQLPQKTGAARSA